MSMLRVIVLATVVGLLSTAPAFAQRNRARKRVSPHETVSAVIAGNEGALRFYRREGASDYLQTLIMPVAQLD